MKKKKLKIGIYSLTSCSGCQEQVLDLEEELPEIVKAVDIANFEMVKKLDEKTKVDVAFVEGCVAKTEEIERVREIRRKCGFLVSMGTCATYGGIPAIRNLHEGWKFEKLVYPDDSMRLSVIKASPLSDYVKVDYFIRGCPMNKLEFLEVLKSLAAGKKPSEPNYAVCVECKKRQVPCLLVKFLKGEEGGAVCLGPITYAGCDAVCPANGVPCLGCRGPFEDSNVESYVEMLEKHLKKEDVKRMLSTFAGTSKKLIKFV